MRMTDTDFGAAIFVAILTVGSVILTLFAPNQAISAIGFGAAMVFGALLIVVQHWSATTTASRSH